MLVAEHLDFDVARIDDELLDEHAVVAERGLGLGAGAPEALGDLVPAMGDAHALAAAPGRRLDHHRIADLVGDLGGALGRFDRAEEARNGRDAGSVGEFLRFDLVAHRLDGARVGSDEDDAGVGERMRESGALGQESVARMDGLGACLLAGGDDPVDQEIGLCRRRRADGDRLVRHFDMQRVRVGFRIDRHGPDPHVPRRPDDPAGNLAPVGDENLLEHGLPSGGKRELSDCLWFYWKGAGA